MLHRGETAAMKSLSKPVSYRTVPMLRHARASARRHPRTPILTNEAGMLFDIRYFHFWNSAKARMFMKTNGLFHQSRNIHENRALIVLRGPAHSAPSALMGRPYGCGHRLWQTPAGDSKFSTSKMKESPTMLLKTKDAIFYPTMCMINKVVSAPIPRC